MSSYLDYAGLQRYDGKVKIVIGGVASDLADEVTARTNADSGLSTRITTLEQAGYITKAVNDLTNYYTKSQTYSKSEVDNLISPLTATTTINVISKSEFSGAGMETHPQDYYGTGIWLITGATLGESGITNNLCLEEIVVRSGTQGNYTYRWEVIGDTQPDLSGYVPKTTKVNGHALSSNITLVASDFSDIYSKTQVDTALNGKVDKVSGKGLSTNDYTTAEKNKLEGIATGAQVNVIETIKVNNTALTPSSKAVNITVPTKTSQITNDSGFITGVTSITNSEIDALFS
jgi:hypothetical protein